MPPQLHPQNRSSPRVLQGDLRALSPAVRMFVESSVALCQPDSLHICDGSDEENRVILTQLEEQGMIKKLPKYDNWYVQLVRSIDPFLLTGMTDIICSCSCSHLQLVGQDRSPGCCPCGEQDCDRHPGSAERGAHSSGRWNQQLGTLDVS